MIGRRSIGVTIAVLATTTGVGGAQPYDAKAKATFYTDGDPREECPLVRPFHSAYDGTMTSRRFPAPWRADKMPDGYVVCDNG
jgi:hypothetical protein